MSRFIVHNTPIEGLQVIERLPVGDERGFLERMFCQETFKSILQQKTIRQINHTRTCKEGTVRGLHFQYPPYAEMKIISCLKGEVWDVAVDLRMGSPTFLRHHGVKLSENNFQSLLIPEGFAHGFQALKPDCEMLYFHTADFKTDAEGSLNALDPRLAIVWPRLLALRSARDFSHPLLPIEFSGIEFP
jgi:dTDP-4-dehydrorhamnose 3,5-epimerase